MPRIAHTLAFLSCSLTCCAAPARLTVGDITVELDGSRFRWLAAPHGCFVEGDISIPKAAAAAQPEADEKTGKLLVQAGGAVYEFSIASEDETTTRVTLQANGESANVTVRTINWGQAPLPCRLEPGDQGHIVHAQVGLTRHAACDSLYDPATDSALTFRQATDGQVRLSATITRQFMKRHRGVPYFTPIDKTVFKTPPCGWCSWYFYYRGLTEDEAVKNLEWMAENLVPFGAEYFQIDDVWQGQGDRDSQWWRDWNRVYTDFFPHGMKWLADEIHKRGMKAGIWLACFGQSDSEFVTTAPERWLVDAQGNFVDAGWVGRYLCDPSSEAGQQYLKDLFQRLAEDWGYDYFKIDGQPTVVDILRNHQASLKSPDIPADDAYRLGLQAIRQAIGPHRFLLGCWGIPLQGIGIMNGSRTGGDVSVGWAGFQPALDCTMRWYFLHNIAWYCDPDTLLVRPPLTLDQARVWASLYGLTGQLLMASDRMYDLPPDRVEILKRVFPPADITPMCLYPYEGRPRIWHLATECGGLKRDVVGLFNWEERPQPITLRFGDALEACGPADPVAVYDFWEGAYLGRFTHRLTLTQRPTSCHVLSLATLGVEPRLISTSRHITQAAVDLKQASWNPATETWAGTSRCVAGDPYILSFVLDTTGEQTWEVAEVKTSGPPATVATDWPLARVTFTPPQNGEVTWQVQFRPVPRPAPLDLAAAPNPQALSDHWRRVRLSWDAVPGAKGYYLTRNQQPLGVVLGTEYTDGNLEPGTLYSYTIQPYGPQGEHGPLSPPAAAKTLEAPPRPPKPDVPIAELTPRSMREGWGKTHFDRSVEGNPLRIGEETFQRGIGTHANAEIIYDIADRGFRRFVALVGIDREITAPQGTCVFQVFVDGQKRFDSDVVRANEPPLGVDVDITGARELKLVVTEAGDNIHYDHADWAEAGFLR